MIRNEIHFNNKSRWNKFLFKADVTCLTKIWKSVSIWSLRDLWLHSKSFSCYIWRHYAYYPSRLCYNLKMSAMDSSPYEHNIWIDLHSIAYGSSFEGIMPKIICGGLQYQKTPFKLTVPTCMQYKITGLILDILYQQFQEANLTGQWTLDYSNVRMTHPNIPIIAWQ